MNKHFAALLGLFILPVSVALADETPPANPNCAPRKEMVKALVEEHQAAPVVAGIDVSSGDARMLEIWSTPNAEEWALVLTDSSGTSCIALLGAALRVAPYKGLDKRTNI